MAGLTLNWSEATVSYYPPGYRLSLELSGEPDRYWCSAFAKLKDATPPPERRSWIVAAKLSGRELLTDGISIDSVDEIRRDLDALVDATNKAAEDARRIYEEPVKRAAAERERAVRELTDRFRSGGQS